MGKKRGDEVVFVHSDGHAPCIHPDNFEFVKALKKKYGPFDVAIHIGDEINNEALSDHGDDPDLPNHGFELELAVAQLLPYYKLFPKMYVLSSNHSGGRFHRRRKQAGLSIRTVRPIGEIIAAPKGWEWHDELIFRVRGKRDVFFHHGLTTNGLNLAKEMGMCVVQGHYHSKFCIEYTSNPLNLNWSMQVGCSFDKEHLATRYNKKFRKRPIVGHGIIINGQPKLLPMQLDSKSEWTGELP